MNTKNLIISMIIIGLSMSACNHRHTDEPNEALDTIEKVIETPKPPQDWANLKRFQDANSKLTEPKAGENRVVFMGNSITEGWINIRPEYFANKPYVNRGIGGQTTPQMLIRFRQDVVDLKPEAVVILAGINDIAGNTGPSTVEMIFDNLKSMTEIAAANNIKVLLTSVLPAYDFPWRRGLDPGPKVLELNAMLKAYAVDNGHTYVNYYSGVHDGNYGLRKELGDDGVHPNAKGYAIMEGILDKALITVLK